MFRFDRRLRLVLLSGLVGIAFASCSNGSSNGGNGGASQPVSQTTQLCQVPALQQLNAVKHPPNSICLRDSVSMINFSEAISISDFNIVAGDIVALDHSSVDMGGAVFLDGSIYLNDEAHFHYAGADVVTGVVKHVDESSNSQMIASFIDSLDAMTPTQDFDTIYTTTVIHSTGPVNVIGIDNIALFDHQRIILAGAPHDVFILNVSGDISTGGDGSGIYLSRDLNPRNVIINNIGHGKPVWIGGYDAINGTLIAGKRSIIVAGSNFIRGALVAGKGISLIGPHGIWNPAGFCIGGTPNPDPSPSPSPTVSPTGSPTTTPTGSPTTTPTGSPTTTPTGSPTTTPTGSPTTTPTGSPTTTPTGSPTCVPASPTPSPSDTSSPEPTPSDSASPSPSPSSCDDVVCGGGPIGI